MKYLSSSKPKSQESHQLCTEELTRLSERQFDDLFQQIFLLDTSASLAFMLHYMIFLCRAQQTISISNKSQSVCRFNAVQSFMAMRG